MRGADAGKILGREMDDVKAAEESEEYIDCVELDEPGIDVDKELPAIVDVDVQAELAPLDVC